MSESMVQHVVVDSGGFIKNAPLQSIGVNIVTLDDVVDEIRDKTTRQRLQVLPYRLKFRQPSAENVKLVTDFAKKTGDYRNLSATDIRVIALTLQLEKELCGTSHIKLTPGKKNEFTTINRPLEKATDIAGFYLNKKKSSQTRTSSECTETTEPNPEETDPLRTEQTPLENCGEPGTDLSTNNKADERENIDPATVALELKIDDNGDINTLSTQDSTGANESGQETSRKNEYIKEGSLMPEDCLEFEDEEEDDDDDDEDGWITPSNIKQVREQMGDRNCEKAAVAVGCLTTDFAMQNVLIQMGLNVISVDGMLIKQARSYVLRCYGCFKVCTNMMKMFCPMCGNQTLQKISMTVDDSGKIHYYMSRRRPICKKGMKYSLPTPHGGKHSNNPILCADQQVPQQRIAKAGKYQTDVFDPDYVAKASPFKMNDITSRAALMGIRDGSGGRQFKSRNPNEPRKKHGRRK